MNYYKRAMEILEEEQDWKAIVVEIAKNNPSKVVNAVDVSKKNHDELILEQCKIEKINGIKICRSLMGLGLKEAKEYCEVLMAKNGIYNI